MFRKAITMITLAIAFDLVLVAGCSKQAEAASTPNKTDSQASVSGATTLSIEETKAIAEEGFIYGLPIVMAYSVMYEWAVDKDSGQWKAPFNTIYNEHRTFTYRDTSVVTPNADTPYSLGYLDLRAEPIVISVPAVEKARYYSVMLTDGNTFNYGYMGSRTIGNDAGNYLVVGPNWNGEKPAGIKEVFHSTTQFSLICFRTQLFNPEDMPNVEAIQAGYKVQPLSAFHGKTPSTKTAAIDFPKVDREPLKNEPTAAPAVDFPKINKELAKQGFFTYLDFALQFAPPGPEEIAIRAQLARIGVGPDKTRDFESLSPEQKDAVIAGMKAGAKKVAEKIATVGSDLNGWRVASWFGDRAYYDGDWLLRAAGAKAGIYGNDAAEAAYPMTKWLANGEVLDGSKHDYELTFPAGQLPPVNAFWSITMYDAQTQLLIENPINRYLINSPMLPAMKKNADGSLTLYIQKNSPGKNKETNWLPAPDGPIYLVMRLYWPKTEAPSILPIGKGTWKPPGIIVAK